MHGLRNILAGATGMLSLAATVWAAHPATFKDAKAESAKRGVPVLIKFEAEY